MICCPSEALALPLGQERELPRVGDERLSGLLLPLTRGRGKQGQKAQAHRRLSD